VNEGFKGRSYCKNNVRIKSSARTDHCSPWHKLKDGDATDAQLQQWWRDTAWPTRFWFWRDVWGRRDQWCVFCTPSLAVCSTRCSQPDLNMANFEATIAAKWTLASLSRNSTVAQAFWWRQLTSSLVVTLCCASSDGIFYNFSLTSAVKINYARNYENWLHFVEAMIKILAVPFLPV